jgi:sugar phosphate isomerase/epimerase
MSSRRAFLTAASSAGAVFLFSPLEQLGAPGNIAQAPGFSLTIMNTKWGNDDSWDRFCSRTKEAGYDGVEIWWPVDQKERDEMMTAMEKHGLKKAFLFGSGENDFAANDAQFREVISAAAKANPLYINCHTGKDYFTADQKSRMISFTLELSKSSGVPVYHETHRGRALYSAPVTRELMENIPGLRLTLDISHWCNVHESLLHDQEETVNLALARTDHIHARIGHPEGPQVSDPRAPEWENAVKTHFGWWDKVVETKKKNGLPLTILTEFGPPDYMPTMPYTRKPLADQWDINVYMMNELRSRYG